MIAVKRDELTAVLVGGPIAEHGGPIAPELGDIDGEKHVTSPI
jgi:hypothetical protein